MQMMEDEVVWINQNPRYRLIEFFDWVGKLDKGKNWLRKQKT